MTANHMDKRYHFIEMQSYWQGSVNSSQVSQQFNFSRTQAQKYLSAYQDLYPDNLTYNKSVKGFIPTLKFTAQYINCEVNEYLNWLDQGQLNPSQAITTGLTHTALNIPQRQVSPQVIRTLVQAIKHGLRIEVDYVSLANPNNEGRIIQPHVFVRTGLRWHLRAYDEKRQQFRDFVLSRFNGTSELLDQATHTAIQDQAWNTQIELILTPDSRFTPQQKSVIEQEYQMQNGQLVVPTRAALAQYLLQEMQVNLKFHDEHPEAQQLVLANKKDIQQWLFNA